MREFREEKFSIREFFSLRISGGGEVSVREKCISGGFEGIGVCERGHGCCDMLWLTYARVSRRNIFDTRIFLSTHLSSSVPAVAVQCRDTHLR